MIIAMSIEGILIEQRFVPAKNLQIAGYLEGLKIDMAENNEHIIHLSSQQPEFTLSHFPFKKKTD